MNHSQKNELQLLNLIYIFTLLTAPSAAAAQGVMDGQACPMCGSDMMLFGSVMGFVLVIAVIAALIALSVFLVRRSRKQN